MFERERERTSVCVRERERHVGGLGLASFAGPATAVAATLRVWGLRFGFGVWGLGFGVGGLGFGVWVWELGQSRE